MVRKAAAAVCACAVLAGCGSPAPAHSAKAACAGFRSWVLAQGGNLLAAKDPGALARAVKLAPSGRLYRDMSGFRAAMITAVAMKSTALGSTYRLTAITAATQVAQDCGQVNPY